MLSKHFLFLFFQNNNKKKTQRKISIINSILWRRKCSCKSSWELHNIYHLETRNISWFIAFLPQIIAIYHICISIHTFGIFPESNSANLNPMWRTDWRTWRKIASADTLGFNKTKRTTLVDLRRKSISLFPFLSFPCIIFFKIFFFKYGPFVSSVLNLLQYGFSHRLWLFWPARHVRS